MEQKQAYNLTEEDCRNLQFGELVSIEIDLYLKSEKKKRDKDYLLKMIIEDYEKKSTRKIWMRSKIVD
jgi:hypothetical protein